MVLMLLTAMALSVTAYYTQAEDNLFTGQSLAAYTLAAGRAERGVQDAVARLRSGVLPTNTLTIPCNDTAPNNPLTACNSTNMGIMLPGGILDNGATLELRTGGGLQYNWIVYKPQAFSTNQNLFGVRAIGYYGYNLTSQNLYTSEVEVMVEIGTGTGNPCTGASDYGGCGGG